MMKTNDKLETFKKKMSTYMKFFILLHELTISYIDEKFSVFNYYKILILTLNFNIFIIKLHLVRSVCVY